MRKTILGTIISVCLILVIGLMLLPSCSPTEPTPGNSTPTTPAPVEKTVIKWRYQNIAPTTQQAYQVHGPLFCDMVKKASDGRLVITPYAAGELVTGTEILNALNAGSIEMGLSGGSYYAGVMPEGSIEGGLPMMITNVEDFVNLWYNLGWEEIMREAYAEQGVYFLGEAMSASITFWSSKPINTLEDLKGLKIRHFGAFMDLFKALGASPVFMPHEDVYTALQTGVVDASGTAAVSFGTDNHYETCKYFVTKPLLAYPVTNCILVSQKEWNKLPDDLKELLTTAARWASMEALRTDAKNTFELYQNFSDWGVTEVEFSAADTQTLIDTAMGLYDGFAKKNDRSAQMIEIWRQYMKK